MRHGATAETSVCQPVSLARVLWVFVACHGPLPRPAQRSPTPLAHWNFETAAKVLLEAKVPTLTCKSRWSDLGR